jgi:hypothetical protein
MLPSATPRALPALVARMSQASHLLFLVFVALFIMTTPFIRTLPGGQLVDTALLTLVLVAGLLVMQTRRGLLVLATLLVVLGVIAR